MARRRTELNSSQAASGSGTTAKLRQQQAPDPASVQVDGRGDADLIGWVAELAISPFEAFAKDKKIGLNASAIAAFLAGTAAPQDFSPDQLRWLGRPHYALLLVFIRLLRHYRQLLNTYTSRHLDHYYRQRLGFSPRPAEPDRVTVAFELAEGAEPLLLAAGTQLSAGDDSQGIERLYRTTKDLYLNHARVRELRAVRVVRQTTNLESVRSTEADGVKALERMLALVYGDEGPGGSKQNKAAFLASLTRLLSDWHDFCQTQLKLDLQGFQRLMRLYKRRTDDGATQEWIFIAKKLGAAPAPANGIFNQSEFERLFYLSTIYTDNTTSKPPQRWVKTDQSGEGATIDWSKDGISELSGIDDLYLLSQKTGEDRVKRFRDELLAYSHIEGGTPEEKVSSFNALMAMKLHICNDWKQINWLLPGMGQSGSSSSDLEGSLRKALGWESDDIYKEKTEEIYDKIIMNTQSALASWLPVIENSSAKTIVASFCYMDDLLSRLESWYAVPSYRLLALASQAQSLTLPSNPQKSKDDWDKIIDLLTTAHHNLGILRRRNKLLDSRKFDSNSQLLQGPAALVATANAAMHKDDQSATLKTWDECRDLMIKENWINAAQRDKLDSFHQQLVALEFAPGSRPRLTRWEEVDAILEEAQRAMEGSQPAPLGLLEWRQLYGHQQVIDSKALAAGTPCQPCFALPSPQDANQPPQPGPGFGVASRLLGLAEGERTITLTLGLDAGSFAIKNLAGQAESEGKIETIQPNEIQINEIQINEKQINEILLLEASTTEGWHVAAVTTAIVCTTPNNEDNYYKLVSPLSTKTEPTNLGYLQLTVHLDKAAPALAPLTPGELPRLRLRLRPWFDPASHQWRSCGGFESMRLAAAHLGVAVEGITQLHLQSEAAPLDPSQPFEPFGSSPVVGSSFYLSHPELLGGDLDELSFHGNWPNFTPNMLKNKYPSTNNALSVFKVNVSLMAQNDGELTSNQELCLFDDDAANKDPSKDLQLKLGPIFSPRQSQTASAEALHQDTNIDHLRRQARVWRWQLTPADFGHSDYPSLLANKAQELAVALSNKAANEAYALAQPSKSPDPNTIIAINPSNYIVPEPYTPLLANLSANYRRSQDLSLADPAAGHLFRVHPFGDETFCLPSPDSNKRPDPDKPPVLPLLLPTYPNAGELYIGLEGTQPPQPLVLAFQLEEGSARGERPTPAVTWDVLDGTDWRSLPVRADGTSGLLQSGLVRLDLPDVAAAAVLPGDLLWLRVSLKGPVQAYATVLAVQAQAVEADFIVEGHEADEDRQPLAPHSITELVEAKGTIAGIQQPFSSRRGRAAETELPYRLRVAEQLRHKGRALAGWDYERLLWDAFGSQLQTVLCLPAQQSKQVEVLVIPNLRLQVPRNLFSPGASGDLLAAMEQHLRQRCGPELDIRVRNATYLPVRVR